MSAALRTPAPQVVRSVRASVSLAEREAWAQLAAAYRLVEADKD